MSELEHIRTLDENTLQVRLGGGVGPNDLVKEMLGQQRTRSDTASTQEQTSDYTDYLILARNETTERLGVMADTNRSTTLWSRNISPHKSLFKVTVA
jgi:hypothetical protein